MATTPTTSPTTAELWAVIKKEITGIQLVWETANGLYFQPQGEGWRTLQADAPLLIHLTQTALMESLLMRMSRLMDSAATGKMSNLSLKQLVTADASIDPDEVAIRAIWDGSGLKTVRDKYLSHNDLNRSMAAVHTLNIPLESADIEALRQLAEGLRALRRNVNPKLSAGAYVDQPLDLQVSREVKVLEKTLLSGKRFFELLPEHPVLQQALVALEAHQ
ncbi:MAG: hypothetical protein RL392_254 [Pseudomonadota bacterium]|jgi:hypothetical protein